MGLYGEIEQAQTEDDYDKNDPFWQAMERGIAKHSLPKVE
jgi:acid phosphatase class B